jgi:hypothetical protein
MIDFNHTAFKSSFMAVYNNLQIPNFLLRDGILIAGEDMNKVLQDFDKLSFNDKLEFLYNDCSFQLFFTKAGTLSNGFTVVNNNTEFKFCVTVNHIKEVDKLGRFVFDKLKQKFDENYILGFEQRLKQSDSIEENKLFINDEIEDIQKKLKNSTYNQKCFYDGYRNELKRIYHTFTVPINFDKYFFTAYGAASYTYEKKLRRKLESLNDVQEVNESSSDKTGPTVAAYALKHLYWSRHDHLKAITKTNVEKFADEYKISPNTLGSEYKFYSVKENLKAIPAEKKENKKTVTPFIKRFEDAALLLQPCCKQGFDDIMKHLELLKEQYRIYLD